MTTDRAAPTEHRQRLARQAAYLNDVVDLLSDTRELLDGDLRENPDDHAVLARRVETGELLLRARNLFGATNDALHELDRVAPPPPPDVPEICTGWYQASHAKKPTPGQPALWKLAPMVSGVPDLDEAVDFTGRYEEAAAFLAERHPKVRRWELLP